MPKLTASERPVLAFLLLIAMALLAAISLVPAVGGAPVHAVDESASELPFSEAPTPDEPPPPVQCPAGETGGDLPEGTQTISGTVTDEAGAVPLEGIQVRFSTLPSGLSAGTVLTGSSGTYAMGNLGDGTYRVSFFDGSGTYQSGFHDASGLVQTHGEADPVVLTGDGAVVDAALPDEVLRNVQGTVTDNAGLPVGGLLLTAQSAYFPMSACGNSLSDGSYAIPGVRTMAFRLQVADFAGAYPHGFYADDAPGNFTTSLADADVLIAGGSDMSGIDIQFPPLYMLSGVVHDDALAPVEGINVSACEPAGEGCSRSDASDEDGAFTIVGLVAGDYIIGMDGTSAGYLNGWYDGQGAFTRIQAEADPVNVSDDVTGRDLLAVPAAAVSGTVTDEHGTPLGEIWVSLYDENGQGLQVSTVDGAYTAGLQPGTYILRVDDQRYPQVYPSGYLGDADSFVQDPAQAIQIIVGLDDVPYLDVAIPDGGTIDFSVVMDGTPVPYASVGLCQTESSCPTSGQTDENGVGSLSAIIPGQYFVQVTADYEHLYWYVSDVAVGDFGAATPVSILANASAQITLSLPSPGADTPACAGDECQPIPLDDGTGATPVELTFENVQEGGTTSLTIPSEELTIPAGFKFGEPPTYYEITTTATLAEGSSYTICVTFDPLAFDNPAGVRLLHFVSEPSPGAWEDTTLPGYPLDGVVCGEAESFSPFALVEREYSFAGFFGAKAAPQLNLAKASDTIGIQFSMGSDIGLAIFQDGSPSVQRVDCVSGELMGSPTTAATGSPALKFNPKTQRYTFQWKTDKAWKDSCRLLVLTFGDGSFAEVVFSFKR